MGSRAHATIKAHLQRELSNNFLRPYRKERKADALRKLSENAEITIADKYSPATLRNLENFSKLRNSASEELAQVELKCDYTEQRNPLRIHKVNGRRVSDGCLEVLAAYAKHAVITTGRNTGELAPGDELAIALLNNIEIQKGITFVSIAAHGLVNRSLDEKTYQQMLRIASTYDGTNH